MRAFCFGIALFLLAPALARAQATVLMRGQDKAPTTWSELKSALRHGEEPAWVVVEDPAQPMAGTLAERLKEAPLVETDFKVHSTMVNGPFGKDLRTALGWEGPHWALLNAKAQVVLAGTRVPSAADLAAQVELAGVKTRLAILAAFVVRNPDHLEAREAYLGELLKVAQRRMAPLLKPQAKTGEDEKAPTELLHPLTEEDDLRIWGRTAAELERFVLSGACLRVSGWMILGRAWEAATLSPTMKAMAVKCLPTVEEALRQTPGHWTVWFWWEKLAAVAGGRPLRPVLASLQPVPGQSPQGIPPETVLKGFIQRAKAAKDWAAIRDLLSPRWEHEQQESVSVVMVDASGKPAEDGLGFSWDNYLSALLEAQLRLGDTQEAQRMVDAVLQWMPGAVSLPRRAAAVAKACGFEDFAARWSAIKVVPRS
jgi:hypothetical protein